MITLPESVAFYWGDPINAAAIDVLSGGDDKVPLDLGLAEAERFELASLAARRVRVEHWRLLRALWAATWGEAVRAGMPRARLLTYGEHAAFVGEINEPYADPSVASAWTTGATAGVFEVPGHGHLFTGLGFAGAEREVELKVYLWGAEGSAAATDTLDLGADWSHDGQDRRVLRTGVIAFMGGEHATNPEPLAALARSAVTALAAALR